ncbi:MAG: acetyl-CoA carboxylase biotin carboxyl carrier protein subunit [Comamonadaceae bacterium]|nr:MAG: acetyl-CoA carboxylase biotin carboxyl carrier protein subunit [Comamonadaceae bacterium]
MTLLQFSDKPGTRHQVQLRAGAVRVDDADVQVVQPSTGNFMAVLDGRPQRLRAVAHGDTVYVQLRGRAWQVNRVDPTRAAASGRGAGEGASHAPMPGVVVSVLVAAGQVVARNDALMVIESMKLQMTISADFDGTVSELPLAAGQTFQRGGMLVRVQKLEDKLQDEQAKSKTGENA